VNVNTHSSSRNAFSNFRINNAGKMGISTSANYLSFSNGVISNSGQDGVRFALGSGRCSLTNVVCINNSQATPNTYSGISIRDSSNRVVNGSTCIDDQGTKTRRWALELESSANSNIVIGCNFAGNIQPSGIVNSRTGNVLANNITG
jgi:hypothetical protein